MALLAWFPLNDNIVNIGMSDASISSTNAVFNDNGKLGKCHSYNGSSYETTIRGINLASAKEFSVAIWLCPTTANTVTAAFEIAYNSYWQVDLNGKNLAIRDSATGPTGTRKEYSTGTWNANIWSHLAVTYNSGEVKIYRDGVLLSTNNTGGENLNPEVNMYKLGRSYNQNYWYNGKLDDYRIYDHCLSAKEVNEIAKGLVLHYKLDDQYVSKTINLLSGYNISWSSLTCVTSSTKTGDVYTVTVGSLNGNYTVATSRVHFPLAILENGTQYSFSFKYKVISGDGDININSCDWCDSGFPSKEIIPMGNYYYAKFVCPIKNYDNTYRFMDFCWTATDTVFEIWDVQLEKSSEPSPYVSSSRGQLYDNRIYTEPDGTTWVKIVHHNNPANALFESTDTFTTGVYKDMDRWFDVYNIVNRLDTYEFMVKQKTTSSATLTKYRWIQNVSPLTATYNDVAPAQVTRITTSEYTDGGFGGLYVKNSNTHIVIANNTSGNWYGALGSWTAYNGGIPGYPNTTITSGYIDLYIRVTENDVVRIFDYSGFRNDGFINGTVSVNSGSPRYEHNVKMTAPGYSQSAIYNYIVAPIAVPASTEITFAFWFKGTTRYSGGIISTSADTGFSDYTNTAINDYDSYLRSKIGDTTYTLSSSNFTINGTWHHYAIVYNGSNLILYKDGVSVQTVAATGSMAAFNYVALNYSNAGGGKRSINNAEYSDFRIYATALSPEYIAELYHTAASISDKGDLFTYQINEID